MKKIAAIVTAGVLYIAFVFSFSFLDSNDIVEKLLTKLGHKKTQTIDVHVTSGADPMPNPPIPPPLPIDPK